MERNEFINRFPNYHRDCDGWGVIRVRELGIGKDCTCIEQNQCPRCKGPVRDSYSCAACGWNRDDKSRGVVWTDRTCSARP